MAEFVAWVEAIGTWVAPGVIFYVGYKLGEGSDRKATGMKVLIETSDHAQRLDHVCSEVRLALALHEELRHEPRLGFEGNLPRAQDEIHVELMQSEARLLHLSERLSEFSVSLNNDCMMAELTFDKRALELIAAIKRFIASTNENDEGLVRAAFNDVTAEVRLLAHHVLGRRAASSRLDVEHDNSKKGSKP